MNRLGLYITAGVMTFSCLACGNKNKAAEQSGSDTAQTAKLPTFDADSAYATLVTQCNFGPRVMNSEAHDLCGAYIVKMFKCYGLDVTEQRANFTGYDGKTLKGCNIIASYRPELKDRILICAHWDSRPWADNDPDKDNHHKPVMAANDGASGISVMMELARLIQKQKPKVGVDFICFDAEDYGTPQWANNGADDENSWSMGSQYWSANPHHANYKARFGILLDMVGGQGAQFLMEGYSKQYAQSVIDKVWSAAEQVGYGSYFPKQDGGLVTDDHGPINRIARIPTIDIIPCYNDPNSGSSFGPTWHTINDVPSQIDRNTLRAVGQTLVYIIYNE